MGDTSLEIEGYRTVDNPTAEYISRALEQITPRKPSFFILSRPDGSFVQAAGSRICLSVEVRFIRPNVFQHGIVGVETDDEDGSELTHVAYSCGTLVVQKKEVLKVRDAQIIFGAFLRTGQIPMPYLVRDVTKLYENEDK